MDLDYGQQAIQSERSEEDIKARKRDFQKRCFKLEGKIGKVRYCVNPISTLVGAIVLWVIIGWALAETDKSIQDFSTVRGWITDKCTWLYVGSQFIWPFLLVYIYFKYGHLKLGIASDLPEYSNFDFFAMVFTTGICNGFYYDGVNQPLVTYTKPSENLIIYRGKDNHVSKAQNSLNVVMYHYGLHSFSVYLIPSLLMSVLAYRKGLPLTIRSCFYPIFGRKIFGRLGDLVDSISIISIGFGVSLSYMLGALLIATGLNTLIPDVANNQTTQIIGLWCVCLLGMMSAASGIRLGIRRISQLCFLTSVFFVLSVALSDNIWYLLNLALQSVGYYIQYFVGTSTYTGAFIQEGSYPGAVEYEREWINENTVLYWGWWLGWAPMVSMFITRISKGRTIKNTLMHAYFLPVAANFIWFNVVGGIVIDMQNYAGTYNLTCPGNKMYQNNNNSVFGVNRPPGVPDWVRQLDCYNAEDQLYIVLEKYKDITEVLQFFAFIIAVLYFVTSYDSSALVMGSISSNGVDDPPLVQRVFWCITLGALTTVLIVYNNKSDRVSVSSFTVIAGIPFAVVECICAVAVLRLLRREPNWSYELIVKWKMLYGKINSMDLLKNCLLAIPAPWYFLGQVFIVENNTRGRVRRAFTYLQFAIPFYLWIILLFLRIGYYNVDNIGWAVFIVFVTYSAIQRKKLRNKYGIEGNIFEDVALMVIFPLTTVQMYVQSSVATSQDQQQQENSAAYTNGINNTGFNDAFRMKELRIETDVNKIIDKQGQEVEEVADF